MDQARLQALTARGYSKAAKRIGAETVQYRPTSLTDPLASPYASFLAAFNNDAGFSFKAPTLWGKPAVFGLFDTMDVQVGDILVSSGERYFVARFEAFQPPLCILCDRTISLFGNASSGDGTTGDDSSSACPLAGYQDDYGTSGDDGSSAVASGWPCSILLKGSGEASGSSIPGAIKAAVYQLLLPVMPGFNPQVYMTATDDLGRSYVIEGVEVSQYGTKCLMRVQQV
ncbi:hypothetical protein [Gluconobacter japonicus]|uniref:hypothetical protein n=1 Tax=Gluconobacter japonicus TaxID=376620 RepID=UPI000781FED3|nr:hypothetical protein [Gluconobacter japonicus]